MGHTLLVKTIYTAVVVAISSLASNTPSDVNKKHINIDVADDECDE